MHTDPLSSRQLAEELRATGFDVELVPDSAVALVRARVATFNLVILDINLPGTNGPTLCRAIRAARPNTDTAILMVSAQSAEPDRIMGLEAGADDYVSKPVGMLELMARIRALMRRGRSAASALAASHYVTRELTLDIARRRALVHGRVVRLTVRECIVLNHTRPAAWHRPEPRRVAAARLERRCAR